MNYYDYGYPRPVPLITDRCCCDMSDLDIEGAVTNAIMSVMPTINENFGDVHTHIDTAKDEIISSECDCGGCHDCAPCVATKCDINNAVNRINEHIDSKFNEIDFTSHFNDLNSQISILINQ